MRRRDALVIGAAVTAALALPPVLRRLPSSLAFDPLPGFDGFRRLSGGAVSGGIDPFLGLGDSTSGTAAPALPSSPCAALFGPEGWMAERVPVAIFSDFNCPYCRLLEDRLIALESAGTGIRLIWHELPLLGDASHRAARAVLAARHLGQERAARAYLWNHSLPPGGAGLRRMAAALDLDAERLRATEAAAHVGDSLAQSLTLGRQLGIYGTPGTVVGRTLVIGAIKEADLRKLISLEREEPRSVCL